MYSDFKLYYKILIIKIVWYWHKNTHRSMEQKSEALNKPTFIWSINYGKEAKDIQWGKDSLFNTSCMYI